MTDRERARAEIRRNREGAAATGLLVLFVIVFVTLGSLVIWGLRSIGLNIPRVDGR